MKITYEPFLPATRAMIPEIRFYYVFASNDDGSAAKLLGIVRRDSHGKWTADGRVFPPVPLRQRTTHQTRTKATESLVEAWTARLATRVGVRS